MFNSEAFSLLKQSAPPLIARGLVISTCQFFIKRAVYAAADESSLQTYGVYSIIEGFVFLLCFRGLRMVSSAGSHLYAAEKVDPNFDPKKMGVLYRQGVLLGWLMMLPAAGLCITSPLIFRLMRQSSDVIDGAHRYFLYGFFAYVGDMLYRSRVRIDIARGKSIYALYGDICESVIDALGTYFLVLGKLGFPAMGVAGGALAYAISTWVTMISYHLITYAKSAAIRRYELYDFSYTEYLQALCHDDEEKFKKFILGGFKIALKFSIFNLTIGLTTLLCSWEGKGASIGLQAAIAYSNLVILPVGGFTDAAATVVGRLFERDWLQAYHIGNVAIASSILFSLSAAGVLFASVDRFASFFLSNTPENQADFNIVKNFLRLQAVMDLVNTWGNATSSVLTGCLKTNAAFWLSISFIFLLNSTLSAVSYYAGLSSVVMYAVQLIGAISNSSGISYSWWNQHKTKTGEMVLVSENKNAMFSVTVAQESPRKYDEEDRELDDRDVSCAMDSKNRP